MTAQDESLHVEYEAPPEAPPESAPRDVPAGDGPHETAARRWRASRPTRWAALAVWVIAFVYATIAFGVPSDPTLVVAWTVAAALALSVGRHRLRTVLVDFLPLAAVVVAWSFLRGAAATFGMPTWWEPQLRIDRALFGGVQPTVWLQEHLVYASARWWNVPITLCYLSFFLLPYVTAVALWVRSRRDFRRWSARWVALSLLAFACFALLPTAPPWAAARCTAAQVKDHPSSPACMFRDPVGAHHLLGILQDPNPGVPAHVVRNSRLGLSELHLDQASRLIAGGADQSDLVAAVPSLHAAATVLFGIFMWRRVKRRWRPLLVAYPMFMAFTLVVSGEHYVFDILVGWLVAAFVSVTATAIEKRYARAKAPAPDPVYEPAVPTK